MRMSSGVNKVKDNSNEDREKETFFIFHQDTRLRMEEIFYQNSMVQKQEMGFHVVESLVVMLQSEASKVEC